MPRSGKTTLALELQKRLNVVRISPEVWIDKLFKKIAYFIENPPAEEEEEEVAPPSPRSGQDPEEAPKKKEKPSLYTPLEDEIILVLQNGGTPSPVQIELILTDLISSAEATTRGFVLDLNFTAEELPDENAATVEMQDLNKSWLTRINECDMLAGKQFTHVVELIMNQQEVIRRSDNMLASTRDGKTYSRWERQERNKPKPKSDDDDDDAEPEALDPSDPDYVEKLVDTEMIMRPCDDISVVNR